MNQCSICFAISSDKSKYCVECGEELPLHQYTKQSKKGNRGYVGFALFLATIVHFVFFRDPLIFPLAVVAYIVRMKLFYNWKYKKYDEVKLKEKEKIHEAEFRDLLNEFSSN